MDPFALFQRKYFPLIVIAHSNSFLTLLLFQHRNGRSRVGVYCAANVAIEQVVQHGEVDVFQAVKTVRRNRPKLVENEVIITLDIRLIDLFPIL